MYAYLNIPVFLVDADVDEDKDVDSDACVVYIHMHWWYICTYIHFLDISTYISHAYSNVHVHVHVHRCTCVHMGACGEGELQREYHKILRRDARTAVSGCRRVMAPMHQITNAAQLVELQSSSRLVRPC